MEPKNTRWKRVLAAGAFVLCVCIMSHGSVPEMVADSEYYIAMASGGQQQAIAPFAKRVLHPLFVRSVATVMGKDVNWSFVAVACFSLLLLGESLALIEHRMGVVPGLVPLLAFSPLVLQMFRQAYLPDLFHAAVLSLLIALQPVGFVVPLFAACLLQATRENTLLLTLSVCVVSLARGRSKLAAGFVTGTVAGLVLSRLLSASAQNVHRLPEGLYLMLKVPFNLLRNVLGVPLWANTLNYCDPWAVWEVPRWLPLGRIQVVGICAIDHTMQLETLLALLTLFGTLPAIVGYSLWHFRLSVVRLIDPWPTVAIVYGLASFLVGACTGASVGRLVGYAWPAFWVGGPWLLSHILALELKFSLWLLTIHELVLWLPYVMSDPSSNSTGGWACVAIAGVAHVVVIVQLRYNHSRYQPRFSCRST